MSEHYEVKCTEILKLCLSCAKNPLRTDNISSCKELGNGFCNQVRIADKALAEFKYWLVDINTRKMHEDVKNQFAKQKADEERKLAPIENATKKDIEKIEKIENQRQQIKNDLEDEENVIFSFNPVGS